MKIKIYTMLLCAKQGLLVLALSLFFQTNNAQTTYTFFHTGGQQTVSLPAGSYSVQCWGGKGESAVNQPTGGIGGYSSGTFSITSATTVFVNVGGKGSMGPSSAAFASGGYNGGGQGYGSTVVGAGGGGATHLAFATGVLSSLSTNTTAIIIVAGGAGASGFAGIGGHGGGVIGGSGNSGTGGNLGSTFGQGANGTTAGTCGGGGGGWFGGNLGSPGNTGGAGGGSGYTGGVSGGINVQPGQAGFITNPDPLGHGYVLITGLCNFSLYASGSNSLNPAICSGQSVTLLTNAVSNYSWSTGATTASLVVSPTTNTVYTLSALSPSNCTTSRSISVTVSAGFPILSISNPSNNICLGRSATLTASGAVSYTWSSPTVVNGQSFTPQSTTNYTVTGANGCGTSSAVTTISVSPLAVTASASSSLVCQGYSATLTAVSAVNGYTWQPVAQTTSLAIVSPTSTTIYTVIASDGICTGSQTLVVTTKTTPTIAITPTVVTLCLGETTTLSASGAGSGGSYSWTPGNSSNSNLVVSPPASTLYIVSGTNSLNCTASAQVPVIIVQALPLNVTATSTLVCSGATVNLSASGSTTYSWTNGPATANYVTNASAALSTYTVTGFNTTNTCTATRTIAIAAITPSVNVSSPVSMCDGGSATVTASGATTYTWNGVPMGGNNVYVASPAQTATYVLLANTNSITTNCPSTHTVQVVVNTNPTVTVIPTRSVICKGQTNTLTATGAASVVWQGTLGITNAVVIKPSITTVYTLTGTSAEGCTTTAQVSAVVSACNGIAEFSNTRQIRVYPNPNNGQFSISSESASIVYLSNAIGQVIQKLELNSDNNFRADLSGLAKGVYFLSAGENQSAKKLIVD